MAGRAFTLVLTLAYPISVFAALSWWNLTGLSILLISLGLLRIFWPGSGGGVSPRLAGIGLLTIGLIALWTDQEAAARAYPVLINAVLLGWFGWSLLNPPSAIERIARISDPELPDYAVESTRKVTWVWSLFFLGNGMAAGYTAIYSSLEFWTLYNGLIASMLMGSLFITEYLVRRMVRARHETDIG